VTTLPAAARAVAGGSAVALGSAVAVGAVVAVGADVGAEAGTAGALGAATGAVATGATLAAGWATQAARRVNATRPASASLLPLGSPAGNDVWPLDEANFAINITSLKGARRSGFWERTGSKRECAPWIRPGSAERKAVQVTV
jgi:hypothetical protein